MATSLQTFTIRSLIYHYFYHYFVFLSLSVTALAFIILSGKIPPRPIPDIKNQVQLLAFRETFYLIYNNASGKHILLASQ